MLLFCGFVCIVAYQGSSHPAPVDAAIANYAAVNSKLTYEYRYGNVPSDGIGAKDIWGMRREVVYGWKATQTQNGEWGFDGNTERYVFKSPNPIGVGNDKDKVPVFEVLYDGRTLAYRMQGQKGISVQRANENIFETVGISPFRIFSNTFPSIFEKRYGSKIESRSIVRRGDRIYEVETYRKELSTAWDEMHVYYDPNQNFVPSYVVNITFKQSRNEAMVREHRMIESKNCKSGGVVPSEWIEIMYLVPNFYEQFRDHGPETHYPLPSSVTFAQFSVTSFTDDAMTSFTNVGEKPVIRAPGGTTIAPSGELSLGKINSLAGKKVDKLRTLNLPSFDAEAVKTTTRNSKILYNSTIGVAVILFVLVVLYIIFRRKRYINTLIIILGFYVCGCEKSGPEVLLEGTFVPNQMIYDTRVGIVTHLVLKNTGNRPLILKKIDGGCSCRQIDPGKLPIKLGVGQDARFETKIQSSVDVHKAKYMMAIETDIGMLNVPVSLVAFAGHQLSPGSFMNNDLLDEAEWEFEVTQRDIYFEDRPPGNTRLMAPEDFQLMLVSQQIRKIPEVNGLMYKDSIYSLRLINKSDGLHKRTVALRDTESKQSLAEAGIVWERRPFLASTPRKVFLGSRSVRVFLRCPDAGVELTRILVAPKGVKAVIVSPREILVSSSDECTGLIDGNIRVATSVDNGAVLDIPVVRFANSLTND